MNQSLAEKFIDRVEGRGSISSFIKNLTEVKYLLKLEWKPTLRKWGVKVDDTPLMRQISQEAGLGGKMTLDPKDYDEFLKAAGKLEVTVETPDIEEGTYSADVYFGS